MSRVSSYVTATIPALVVLGFFVWFANWIPQTRWEPPERQEISAGMTPVELAKIGGLIARQRGCMACHTIEPGVGVKGGGRGPNFAAIAARRAQGVPGGRSDLVGYLAEALYDPGAYLVGDYPDIMPAAAAPPAKLRYEEVVAVIDYLQSLGGTPSVKVGDIPRPPREAAAAVATAGVAAPSEISSADTRAVLAALDCLTCHSLEPGEVLVGPAFDTAALRQAATGRGMSAEAYVMEAIVSPRVFEREEFPSEVMPQDYGERLTAGQLQAMVSYLLTREGEQ